MKNLVCLLLSLFVALSVQAQERKRDLYDPEANATLEIESLIKQANQENKHIILQVGGNWCGWCYLFHDFIKENEELNKIVEDNYLLYHLNYSKENKNTALLAKYQFPQRFGFPVLLILNQEGSLIHTQNSALLEEGKGYDLKKVKEFFMGWTAEALDPSTYNK
jgi:thiol:disulfide interchange protein